MTEQAVSQQEAMDDADLVARVRGGERDAIILIMQHHNQRLYRLARGIVRDDSEAEDVLQEAYMRAFAHLEGFRGDARLSTWLSRIVMNEALGRLRRRRPTIEWDRVGASASAAAQIVPFPGAGPQLDPEASVAQREIRILLERAIDALPQAFRLVFVARMIDGMSIAETAELLGIPPDTVKTRLHRARRLLRLEMRKYIGPVLGGAFPFGGRRCQRLTQCVLARLGYA